MILKKEQISNAKIHCYLTTNSKISKVTISNKTFDMDLSNVKEIESSDKYDIACNYLLRINKLLSSLKNQDENFINSDIKIFVDNKLVEEILKPNGSLEAKPSKEIKKMIDNQRLKAMLGITLKEIATFNNIDLIFENFLQKEENNMDNNQNNNFELDMDISGLDDIIGVSDVDSLNFNEDDLFKGFDLNTDNLFGEKENTEFIFEEEKISIPECTVDSTKINADEETFEFIYSDDSFATDIKVEEPKSEEIITTEIPNVSTDSSFEVNNNNETSTDDFTLDLDMDDMDDDFIFTTDSSTESLFSKKEEDSKPIDEVVYAPTQEDTYQPAKEEVVYEPVKEEVYEPVKEEVYEHVKKEVYEPVKESTIVEEPTKEVIDTTETLTTSKKEEEVIVNKNNVENNKSLDINDEFIQNELVELKKVLEDKANSYRSKFNELYSEYETKHLALKDLNLTDETQQLQIFKDFLSCKSTMIKLESLENTCKDIANDIEKRILKNIKK